MKNAVIWDNITESANGGQKVDKFYEASFAAIQEGHFIWTRHNHPSGTPVPSVADINETNKLRKACDIFDISLLDHIILTDESYYSFADESQNKF